MDIFNIYRTCFRFVIDIALGSLIVYCSYNNLNPPVLLYSGMATALLGIFSFLFDSSCSVFGGGGTDTFVNPPPTKQVRSTSNPTFYRHPTWAHEDQQTIQT